MCWTPESQCFAPQLHLRNITWTSWKPGGKYLKRALNFTFLNCRVFHSHYSPNNNNPMYNGCFSLHEEGNSDPMEHSEGSAVGSSNPSEWMLQKRNECNLFLFISQLLYTTLCSEPLKFPSTSA